MILTIYPDGVCPRNRNGEPCGCSASRIPLVYTDWERGEIARHRAEEKAMKRSKPRRAAAEPEGERR